jgi:hypothetical protein
MRRIRTGSDRRTAFLTTSVRRQAAWTHAGEAVTDSVIVRAPWCGTAGGMTASMPAATPQDRHSGGDGDAEADRDAEMDLEQEYSDGGPGEHGEDSAQPSVE